MTLVLNNIDITYSYEKIYFSLNTPGQRFKNFMINVFRIAPRERHDGAIFAYSHIVYHASYPNLKKGWNIIIYGQKALVTKGSLIFQDVKNFILV